MNTTRGIYYSRIADLQRILNDYAIEDITKYVIELEQERDKLQRDFEKLMQSVHAEQIERAFKRMADEARERLTSDGTGKLGKA